MKCLVGLGNPGKSYTGHRHNFGFQLVDFILKNATSGYQTQRMSHSHVWRNPEVILAKPATFMNHSGQAVAELLAYSPIQAEEMLIAYDDISLDFGNLRIRKQGSAGSHNGMKSIIQALGTPAIPRLRLGIGPKPMPIDLADYVLTRFTRQEHDKLPEILAFAEKAFYTWLNQGLDSAMNLINQQNSTYSIL